MAEAKKCDRCGTLYEDHKVEYLIIRLEYTGIRTPFPRDQAIPRKDLCPKCYQELLEFLNVKKETDNHAVDH